MRISKKLSKALALVIMLALVMGIMPMGAMATTSSVYVRFFNGATQIGSTVSVTASDDTAYTAITAAIAANSSITSSSVTANGVHSINGIDPGATETGMDAWMYTVDDKLAYVSIGSMPVSANSVVTVFYVTNYTTAQYAYIVPDGAATIGNAIAAGSSDTIYYRVATATVDFNDQYSTISSTSQSTSGVSSVSASPSVNDYTVIPAFKPVIGTESGTLAAWKAETLAAYNALTSTQKSSLTSLYNAANASDATMSDVNALANAVAPLTRENSTKLNRLYFTQGSDYLNLRQASTYNDGFDPDITSYTLETVNSGFNVNYAALGTGTTVTISGSTGMTVSGSTVSFASSAASGNYTLTVTVAKTGFTSTTYTITVPYAKAASGGAIPSFVNGYLPVGQYATGATWGSVYTSYNNVNGNSHNDNLNEVSDAYTKTTNGYVATGVSLGAPGGYIQLAFKSEIENKSTNPYGIDFVIYGNPFNGNPEAGSVKVSANGTDWYELAGSRYYNSETMRNTTISYKMVPTSTYGSNKKADIYYAIGTPPTGTGTTGWTLFKSNVVWWPEAVSEGYGRVSGVSQILDGTDTVNDVTYQQLEEVVNGYNCWIFTHRHVTLVKDTDTTDDYLFGYADVRNAGNAKDGTACNPYASTPSTGTANTAGGDGYDISWAVDTNGEPVALSSIKYIRIYTSAALDPNNLTAMPTPGIFGETSTEVNGVFVAKGSGSGSAAAPSITIGGLTIDDLSALSEAGVTVSTTTVSRNQQIITISGASAVISPTTTSVVVNGGTYVYMNGDNTTTKTVTLGSTVNTIQIISQSGTAEPYITLLKVS